MEEDMKKTYKLKGLDCANCLAKMERKISRLKGVRNVTSNFFTEKMVIEADDILMPEIEEAVSKIATITVLRGVLNIIMSFTCSAKSFIIRLLTVKNINM
jgi:copper chaperone CopZ